MARNTLEAVFGALGAGIRGYGRDTARRREEEQAEIARQDELARTLAERQLRIFQSGLEEAAPATQRAQNVGQFGQMAQATQGAMPAPLSAVGRALQSAGSGMQTDIQRGRRVDIGGTEYVQPFSRTPQGIEERDLQRQAQQASIARQRELQDIASERQFRAEEARKAREGAASIANIRADAVGTGRAPQRPTEAQEKSYLFANRMTAANPVIEQYGPTARLDRISAALAADNVVTRALANRALTPEEQQLVVAIRQFAEPILRKNTGAAFNREEIAWVEQQVIPVSGDSPEAQEFKRQAREREIEAFNALATPATQYYGQVGGQQTSAAPTRQEPTQRPPLSSFRRP